jgi:hypothetical protein
MIIHDCVQGSESWLKARLGIPTASEFSKIITPAKGELSKSARSYAQQLVAETLMGEPIEPSIGNLEWVARGKLLEPVAVQQFEFTLDIETRAVGFITTDCGRIGCSPDRLLVGQNGCLEVKCPSPAVHISYLTDGPGLDHKCQIQGLLAVGEFEFCNFYSYHPQLPPALVRVERDEPYISKMRAALGEFLDMRDAMLEQAKASGFFNAQQEAA